MNENHSLRQQNLRVNQPANKTVNLNNIEEDHFLDKSQE